VQIAIGNMLYNSQLVSLLKSLAGAKGKTEGVQIAISAYPLIVKFIT